MDVYFLEAYTPLTKSFTRKNGELVKTPYPFVWDFTSYRESITSLTAFEKALQAHAKLGHCALKGTIRRDLVKESRAGSTETNTPTEWVVLDLDGLPLTVTSIDDFLASIGIPDTSYILQWSASYGIESKRIRAHLFFMLEKPVTAPLLKQWLIHLNHTNAELRSAMTLTKTGNSISWPLDISACQNDKLIYIAPPILKGIKDPLPPASRIQLVKKRLDRLVIPATFNSEKNRIATQKRLDELRDADGLPKRKHVTKMHGTVEVLAKPDVCTITEMKQERGFVYFNLNGGDSWAYYHPENNPDFILNFKGEPSYLTKELLPDYWSELCSQSTRTSSEGMTYLAFCDKKTASYWVGTYDGATDTLDINLAKTPTQCRDFAKQVGLPMGDFIPQWDIVFDPTDNVRVDFQNRTVNMFSPSSYMKAVAKETKVIPKTINKVITHALGGDQEIVDHFINWCAFIIQMRDRTTTAWIMHGTTGTGKGILMNKILRPLLGVAHTAARRMEELNEPYNHYMKNSFLVFVDEVQTKALQNERGVMAKLKNFITEEYVPIRAMWSNAHEARNYTNWIFASNKSDPVAIEGNDRRFNVGKYQPVKLMISDKELAFLEKELQSFHDYLLYFKLDAEKARTVIDSADRTTMISISESSIDTVAGKMLEGSFEFFIDQLPAGTHYPGSFDAVAKLENYKITLRAFLERTDSATGRCSVSREELRTVFDYVIGQMPTTPNKFTSLLKHHRIHIEKVWLDNRTVSGIKVTWQDVKSWPLFEAALVPPKITPKLAVVQGKPVKKAIA